MILGKQYCASWIALNCVVASAAILLNVFAQLPFVFRGAVFNNGSERRRDAAPPGRPALYTSILATLYVGKVQRNSEVISVLIGNLIRILSEVCNKNIVSLN